MKFGLLHGYTKKKIHSKFQLLNSHSFRDIQILNLRKNVNLAYPRVIQTAVTLVLIVLHGWGLHHFKANEAHFHLICYLPCFTLKNNKLFFTQILKFE